MTSLITVTIRRGSGSLLKARLTECEVVERVHGAVAAAQIPASPCLTASLATWFAWRAASGSDRPAARPAARAAECVQPAPWVAATSYLGTGIDRWRRPSKRWSAGSAPCPPVTSAAAAPIATSRSASAARSSVARPVSACASGRLGVTTVARGNSRTISVATASGSSSRAPELATMTGSTTSGMSAPGQLVGDRAR